MTTKCTRRAVGSCLQRTAGSSWVLSPTAMRRSKPPGGFTPRSMVASTAPARVTLPSDPYGRQPGDFSWRPASGLGRLARLGLLGSGVPLEYGHRNVVPVSAPIDHLFDRGFISFEDIGRLVVSPVAHGRSLEKMGVRTSEPVTVGRFSEGQRRFLEFHRENVFLERRSGRSKRGPAH